jgi:hypothetical protein
MVELIHDTLLWLHIPFGTLSLLLFWIPVGVKKGSPLHRKVGWYYYITMWIVVATAFLMSICNIIMANYIMASFLGYLTIITAYPLWYSYEILHQKKEWTDRYFTIRKIFASILFVAGLGLFLMGIIQFKFAGIGIMMAFFGLLGITAIRDVFMSKTKAMDKETKLKMHIQGTIISGIAAYTAFFAFGGNQLLMGVLHLSQQWMLVPWIAPTFLGVAYARYMKRKYQVGSAQ